MQGKAVALSSVPRTAARLSVACLLTVVGLASSTYGQSDSKSDFPPVPVDNKLERKGATIKRFVKAPVNDPAQQQQYQAYFDNFFFQAMKQSAPADLGRVGELRFALFKDYLWPATPAIQADLTGRAMTYARGVLGGHKQYHPAVGYNAVLVLGGLDAQYGSDARQNKRPPQPLPEANKLLVQIVKLAMAKRLPIALEAGALVGLERHARYSRSLPRDALVATFQTLSSVTQQTDFPSDVDPEVQGWIKRQACQGLANLGAPDPQGRVNGKVVGSVAKALTKVIGDETLSVNTRISITEMLADMRFENVRGVDFAALFTPLQQIASQMAEEDRATAKEYEDFQVKRRGRGAALDQLLDHERFFVEESVVKLRRNYLAARLQSINRAMEAVRPAANDRAGDVDAYVAAIRPAFAAVNNERSLDLDISEALTEMADRIAELTPKAASPVDTAEKPAADGSRR